MSLKNANCILCVLQPIIFFGSLSGYCCVSSLGHHKQTKRSNISIQISKTKVFLTVSSIAITLYYLLNQIWIACNIKYTSADEFIVLLNEILSCLGDISVKIYFLIKTGDKIQTLLTYQSTFINNRSDEINECISIEDIKSARKLQFLYIFITFSVLSIYAGIFWNYADATQNVKAIVDLQILYSNMIVVFQINCELILIYLLFYKMHREIIKVLARKLTRPRNAENVLTPIIFVSRRTQQDVRDDYQQNYLSRDLRRLRQFHITATKHFKILNRYFNTSLADWCSFVSVILMINSYIIVTSCLNTVTANATIVISSAARFIVYSSTLVVFLFHAQHIMDVVSVFKFIFAKLAPNKIYGRDKSAYELK